MIRETLLYWSANPEIGLTCLSAFAIVSSIALGMGWLVGVAVLDKVRGY